MPQGWGKDSQPLGWSKQTGLLPCPHVQAQVTVEACTGLCPLSASVVPLGLPHPFVPTLVWATGVSCLAICGHPYSGPHTSPLIILSLHSSDTILLKCQGLVTPSPEADRRSLRIKDKVRPSAA